MSDEVTFSTQDSKSLPLQLQQQVLCVDAAGIEDVCSAGVTYVVQELVSADLVRLVGVKDPVFAYRFQGQS